MGRPLVMNQDDQPIKATVERALGPDKFSVRIWEDHKEIMSYDEIIQGPNKKIDDGSQYWILKDIIGHRKVYFNEENYHPEWQVG